MTTLILISVVNINTQIVMITISLLSVVKVKADQYMNIILLPPLS